MKRTIAVICGILLIAALLCLNSARLSLWKQGFPVGSAETVWAGRDAEGRAYRVVRTRWEAGSPRLAYQIRGFAGWWVTDALFEPREELQGVVIASWAVPGQSQWTPERSLTTEWERHIVYAGTNAAGAIELPPEKLPPDVTVSVGQQGANYLLHFISYDEAAMNGMEPYTWLQEAGYVPQT